jgi:hypothetical protein
MEVVAEMWIFDPSLKAGGGCGLERRSVVVVRKSFRVCLRVVF